MAVGERERTQLQFDACQKLLFVVTQELGVMEIPGPKAEARIVEYHSFTTLKATSDEVPWCSSLVNFVVATAGFPITKSAAARSWLKWGKKLSKPVPGCIVIFDRKDKNNPNAAHVAFFLYEEKAHGTIKVRGGNQQNMVKDSSYYVTKVLGYRSPI